MSHCWLIPDPRNDRLPQVGAQFAQLFGLACQRWGRSEILQTAAISRNVVALNYRTLVSLSRGQALMLRRMIQRGAILYIRGGFDSEEQCSLFPIADITFSVVRNRHSSEYLISDEQLVPKVLRGEIAQGDFSLPCARGLSDTTRPLAIARFEDGERAPFLFAVPRGAGAVICDLLPDTPAVSAEQPIFDRFADPQTRHAELGALFSVRLAAGLEPDVRPPVNLVLDDRPANFDYLNSRNLRRWLEHVNSRFSGVHVDFAWTPDQLHASLGYVRTLKQFNTGVVWHGFKHHVNHRRGVDLASSYRDGLEMVRQISVRFQVEFQRIMVFPFEAFGADVFPFLDAGGFLATFADRLAPIGLWSPFPSFMDYSMPLHEQFSGIFPVLRRSSCESLTWDSMLSHAALDLPIILTIHPEEIALRRWPHPFRPLGKPEHCDHVLSFAASKGLPSLSLEEIANQQITRPQPLLADSTELASINGR